MKNIVVSGSIAYDYLMRFPGSFREHIMPDSMEQISLSFLVDDMTKHWGGVAANIAFNMATLGESVYLMGTVGRDFTDYRKWLEDVGVDTRTVQQHNDLFTASFFCNTDNENNQIASFYSGAMARASGYALKDIHGDIQPDLVIISPNDPAAMSQLIDECRSEGIPFVYDPSQQIARIDGDTLRHDMAGAYMMVINQYESNMIMKKTGMSMDDLLKAIDLLIITHGAEGSEIYTNGEIIQIPAFEPNEILDPTGAGDAYRAGFLVGLVNKFPLKLCGEIGALNGTYALEHIGSQDKSYTIPEFIVRFRENSDDKGALDILLKQEVV